MTSLSLSCTGEGNGNPPQCSCLENPRDGGAWWAAIYGVTQSRTRLKRLSSSSTRCQSNAQNSPSQASTVRELTDVQAGFRKGRGTRDQTANIHWIIEKAREFQENIYFCFMNYTLACVDHKKLWKILQEMGIPDHLTCLLRNLHAGQEATVRTGHGITDWFQTGKGVRQGYILSPCLFNLYAEYIMRNARLNEAQAGIKIAEISITSDMQMTLHL